MSKAPPTKKLFFKKMKFSPRLSEHEREINFLTLVVNSQSKRKNVDNLRNIL